MNIENRLLVKSSIQELDSKINALSQIFYRHLFNDNPELARILPTDVIALNKKFFNMMAVFKNVKHLEKIEDSIKKLGERHLLNYGAQLHHFDAVRIALFSALKEFLDERFDSTLQNAWYKVYEEVSNIIKNAIISIDRRGKSRVSSAVPEYDGDLLKDIGGEEVITAVHQRFYDIMFDEPWLERFFYGKNKSVLVRKQSEFMIATFGGENRYKGDTPAFVHMHMLITEEQLKIRETILHNALKAEGLADDLITRWLTVDRGFWSSMIKQSEEECVLKCKGQRAITVNKPKNYTPPCKY